MKMKFYYLLMSIFLATLLLSACQNNPSINTVVSKNDGSFDVNVVESASESHSTNETQEVSYLDQFQSTDGTVNFTISLDTTIMDSDMSVVRVAPYYLSSEDAKRVANVLFPNSIFYEVEPPQLENLSKEEILTKITRWTPYTNAKAVNSLYSNVYSESAQKDVAEVTQSFIERYTLMYESAPEEETHEMCRWTMRKSSEYYLLPDELAQVNTENDNDEISAQLTESGIPYRYTVSTRNKNDFKVNAIVAYINEGLCPDTLDTRIFRAELCRTEEPGKAQLDEIKKRAEKILEQMDMGEWKIDRCYVRTDLYGDAPEYVICVSAVPVLNGIAALRLPQLASLRNEEGYAPKQYLSDVNFEFAPNGELISFDLYTPLEIVDTVNTNVKVIPMEDLLNRAKELLALYDYYAFSFGYFVDFLEENVQCNVTISVIEYGLLRVPVPDNVDEYYYVPAVTLKGHSEYVGKNSGKVYSEDTELETILSLNAVDGTVIDMYKG